MINNTINVCKACESPLSPVTFDGEYFYCGPCGAPLEVIQIEVGELEKESNRKEEPR